MGTRQVVPEPAGYFQITPPRAQRSRLAKGPERAVTGACSRTLSFDSSTSISFELSQTVSRLSF